MLSSVATRAPVCHHLSLRSVLSGIWARVLAGAAVVCVILGVLADWARPIARAVDQPIPVHTPARTKAPLSACDSHDTRALAITQGRLAQPDSIIGFFAGDSLYD